MPEKLNDSELFELVKTYQVHDHSRIYWKYSKNECGFSHDWYFTAPILAPIRWSKLRPNSAIFYYYAVYLISVTLTLLAHYLFIDFLLFTFSFILQLREGPRSLVTHVIYSWYYLVHPLSSINVEKTDIAKPLHSNFRDYKKKEVLK